jgi:hypothetical protein
MPGKLISMRILFLLLAHLLCGSLTAQENPVFAFVLGSTLDIHASPNDTSRIIYSLKKYE